MKDDSYVVILPFMVNELKLKGAELITYAIIHSFTMAGQTFNGGTKYLMEWTATNSKPNIVRVLKSLTDKGLLNKVEKTINGVKFCEYTTVVLKENQGGSEIEPGVVLKQNQGGSKTEPNNKDNIQTDNKDYKKERGFTPPTLEEVREYVSENDLNVDAEYFYKFFTEGNWVDSKGNKVRSWKQKLLTWSRHDSSKPKEQDYKDIGVVRE